MFKRKSGCLPRISRLASTYADLTPTNADFKVGASRGATSGQCDWGFTKGMESLGTWQRDITNRAAFACKETLVMTKRIVGVPCWWTSVTLFVKMLFHIAYSHAVHICYSNGMDMNISSKLRKHALFLCYQIQLCPVRKILFSLFMAKYKIVHHKLRPSKLLFWYNA